jgi:hypothetical protein
MYFLIEQMVPIVSDGSDQDAENKEKGEGQ